MKENTQAVPAEQETPSGRGRDLAADRAGDASAADRSGVGRMLRLLAGSGAARNVGLVVALVLLCAVGLATGGQRFGSWDNVLTILRLA